MGQRDRRDPGVRRQVSGGSGAPEEIHISPDERDVLRSVDGEATVQSIVDRSPMGEFDVYRILYELLNRHLIEEVPHARPAGTPRRERSGPGILSHALTFVVLLAAAFSVATFSRNPLNPWKMAVESSPQSRLDLYGSRGRLERLERNFLCSECVVQKNRHTGSKTCPRVLAVCLCAV